MAGPKLRIPEWSGPVRFRSIWTPAAFIGADDVPWAELEKPRNEWIGLFSVPRLGAIIELSVSLFKPLGYDFEGRCISALD